MIRTFLNGRIGVATGDITTLVVDAIVNAANASLLGGGGVDGAIHRAGGPTILEECRQLRRTRFPKGLPTGAAVITTGGDLAARHVIHTVGPIWADHEDPSPLLASCYANSIALAAEHRCRTLAFPAISTGVFGYPKDDAARVASAAIREALERHAAIEQVQLVFFSRADVDLFLAHQRFERGGVGAG